MSIVLPTYRGSIMLTAALSSLGIALVNVSLGTALTAACLIGIVVASFCMTVFSLSKLEVRRLNHRDGIRHDELLLPLLIINHSFWSQQAMVVSERCPFAEAGKFNSVLPPLASGEAFTLERQVKPTRRGYFQLNRLSLISGDPAGLFYRKRNFNLPTELMIFPKPVNNAWLPLRLKHHAIADIDGRALGRSGQGQDFFGVREYRKSDEYRLIDWKATASKRQLMVKEFEANAIDQVIVLLDTEQLNVGFDPGDNNFEFLIETVASITEYMAEMYCRYQFFAADNDQMIRLTGYSSNIKAPIINALALIQPGQISLEQQLSECIDYIHSNSIFYCLSMSNPKPLQPIFELLLEQNIDVRWIYAPPQCFPIIDPEKPRRIRRGAVNIESKHGVMPEICTFQSDIAVILRNE
ncbi:MAG: DUF58 domain-containing protein [Victivallaceae bacterium]|nr:DUF58 domain-containing protein [Victivallaceae bacterium]